MISAKQAKENANKTVEGQIITFLMTIDIRIQSLSQEGYRGASFIFPTTFIDKDRDRVIERLKYYGYTVKTHHTVSSIDVDYHLNIYW